MDYITPIVLGIIEGFTEFLPISSTGHLIIANQWFRLEGPFQNTFNVVIQFGAILSVMVYFRKRILPFFKSQTIEQKHEIYQTWKLIFAGVIPAIILGAIFDDVIEKLLFNPLTVAIALFVGGIILVWIESRKKEIYIDDLTRLGYKRAILIGLFQCLAMIPGTSRSAATIIGSMLLGASRRVAAEFSFFLAIPTMLAASTYSLLQTGWKLTPQEWQALAIGFIVSFIVALIVIAGFMNYVSKRDFKIFGYYRIVLAIGLLIYLKPF